MPLSKVAEVMAKGHKFFARYVLVLSCVGIRTSLTHRQRTPVQEAVQGLEPRQEHHQGGVRGHVPPAEGPSPSRKGQCVLPTRAASRAGEDFAVDSDPRVRI